MDDNYVRGLEEEIRRLVRETIDTELRRIVKTVLEEEYLLRMQEQTDLQDAQQREDLLRKMEGFRTLMATLDAHKQATAREIDQPRQSHWQRWKLRFWG